MTEGIEAITSAALGLALDAAGLRQQAIASNIANANVDGYLPLSVNFDAQLDDARQALNASGRLQAGSLVGVAPRLEQGIVRGTFGRSTGVQLDVEVAHLAENGLQYQALVKGLSKHYEMLTLAVKDGKA
jgi:flagellar basal-body rod protein FlgB